MPLPVAQPEEEPLEGFCAHVRKDIVSTSLSGYSFLLAEDEALEQFVSGIAVADERNGVRKVPTWFRYPTIEFADIVWPFITMEYTGMEFDRERAHTHAYQTPQDYLIDEAASDGATVYRVAYPIPMLVTYTVATHCREPRHDRMLTALFTTNHFNERYATLVCPLDQTLRRILVRAGGVGADYMDPNQKRVLQKVWQIAITTEIPVERALRTDELPPEVTDVLITTEILN